MVFFAAIRFIIGINIYHVKTVICYPYFLWYSLFPICRLLVFKSTL